MPSEKAESLSENVDEARNCGDPLKYAIPKEDGNLWEKLLQPLLLKDKQQCDAWKEEVENLLIFAGLFSAVVTAFVVETYKDLQPDTNDTVIALLAQIASTLDGTQNGTSSQNLFTASHNPPSSAYRVNTLWFISLVLSLTDVLVGTVALQWLRAHQRYPVQMAPRDKFAVFNMRREGLEVWYVPQVFSALPMLLQASLVFFLGGLVDFLLAIAPAKVFIPIIIFIVPPIMFIVLTTAIPSFQWILPPTIFLYLWGTSPWECPYKSPQSFALSSVLTPLLRRVCRTFYSNTTFLSWNLSYLMPLIQNNNSVDKSVMALYYRASCQEEEYQFKNLTKLSPRRYKPDLWRHMRLHQSVPVTDLVLGLYYAVLESDSHLSVQHASYHCIRELANIQDEGFPSHAAWCQYVQNRIKSCWRRKGLKEPFTFDMDILDKDAIPPDVAEDELLMACLEIFQIGPAIPQITALIHELHLRLMKFYLPRIMQLQITKPVNFDDSGVLSYTPRCYITSFYYRGLDAPVDIRRQYVDLLKNFLTTASSIRLPANETIYAESSLPSQFRFISTALNIAAHSLANEDHLKMLQFMKDMVTEHLPSQTSSIDNEIQVYPFGLFFCIALYCGELRYRYVPYPWSDNPPPEYAPALEELIVLLARFHKGLGGTRLHLATTKVSVSDDYYAAFWEACKTLAASSVPTNHSARSIRGPSILPVPSDGTHLDGPSEASGHRMGTVRDEEKSGSSGA